MLRTNFLFYGCRLVLLSGGGVGCWEGGNVGSRAKGTLARRGLPVP